MNQTQARAQVTGPALNYADLIVHEYYRWQGIHAGIVFARKHAINGHLAPRIALLAWVHKHPMS